MANKTLSYQHLLLTALLLRVLLLSVLVMRRPQRYSIQKRIGTHQICNSNNIHQTILLSYLSDLGV